MGYFEENRNVPMDGPWCDLVWFSEAKDHNAMFFHCGQNYTRQIFIVSRCHCSPQKHNISTVFLAKLSTTTTWLKDTFLCLLSMRRRWRF